MKKPIFLAIALFSLVVVSSSQGAAKNECTLENATDFHTALALATSDAVVALSDANSSETDKEQLQQMTEIIEQEYEAKVREAASHLSDGCLLELLSVKSVSSQCEHPIKVAYATFVQRMTATAQEYARTGNRKLYETAMRKETKDMLGSLPQACWFQPLSQATQSPSQASRPCPTDWSAYEQCEEDNKRAIVTGQGSLNNLTRKYVKPCFRPTCPKY